MSPNREFREPSNLRTFGPPDLRPGFTLIEVLVATTVMAIMVLMLGGVFQQASSSWDSGYARAEGGMAVRAVVGSLERDLLTAVDGRRYGLGDVLECSGGSLKFYRLTDDGSGGAELVEYSGGSTVKRNGKTLYESDKNSGNAVSFSFYAGGTAAIRRTYERTAPAFRDNAEWTVPYVKVRCQMTRKGNITGLTVRSWGKDGKESGDDIVVR